MWMNIISGVCALIAVVAFITAGVKVIYNMGKEDGIRESKGEVEMLQKHVNQLLKIHFK